MATESRKHERPSTYVVQDRSNREERERERALLHDQMLTAVMGGVLPEQADPTQFREVFDIGCGYGGWLIEAAQQYPTMSRLVGVDINGKMLECARAEAEAQGVADRVEFYTMDALRMLDFPDDSFDLVNQRLGVSYLRIWEWPDFLQICQRIVRPEGVIRVTECTVVESNSPALTQLSALLQTTLFQSGHIKAEQRDGLISMLPELFVQQGFQQVQTQTYSPRYPAGTRHGELFVENMKHIFRTFVPFFRRWTRIPNNYEELYQQALLEMQQPDFVGAGDLLTVWGNPPARKVITRGHR